MASERTSSPPPARDRVSVLLPLPLGKPYDYRAIGGVPPLPLGTWVRAPLGRRDLAGVVWDRAQGRIEEARIKDLLAVYDLPPLPAASRRFVDWTADYNLAPAGAVLRMAMSVPAALEPPPSRLVYRPGSGSVERMTEARRKVLAAAETGPPRGLTELAREAGVGPGVVKALADAGALEQVAVPGDAPYAAPDPARPPLELSSEQAHAAARLGEVAAQGGYQVVLLEGVTGAGKTEVYLEAMATALRAGRQVLVLLPEIALTAQWHDRFLRRFGVRPAEWHSALTVRERRRCWRAVLHGEARVVVGARSALYLPFPELGLIVVDEEHDPSYKQEDGVIYNARDMAVVRGLLGDCGVVLVSATPSLESVVNVRRDRYRHIELPERHGGARMPEIVSIDMRRDSLTTGQWISAPLRAALTEALEAGEQAMLFLNRRGYAPLTLCRACGHRISCPNCSSWLVTHRLRERLQCHHCGYERMLPRTCPECGAESTLVPIGPGVERVAEEVARLHPAARLAEMTSDSPGGVRRARALVEDMALHRIDVLIGTQVVAKGHHFPMLTLVGVVDADLGLAGGDLRAAERTFQLLSQVAGRAGRAERAGRVLLQSYMPEHPVMAALAAGDKTAFERSELASRERFGMPPYGRLAAIIVAGRELGAVEATAHRLRRAAPAAAGVEILGPAPAPISLLRGRHRMRLLAKTRRKVSMQGYLRRWLAGLKWPNAVTVRVDVDPYSFS